MTDESKVPSFTLPDPLTLKDGAKVTTPPQWRAQRRPEILELYRREVYGHAPDKTTRIMFRVLDGATATQKQVRVQFGDASDGPGFTLTLYLPDKARRPAPAFLGWNFGEKDAKRWPVEKITGRGYALVTACYSDIEPDSPDGWQSKTSLRAAMSPRLMSQDWSAIGVWAWALSRALDYLETDADVDAKRVAVFGHSRLGKTALWTGAQDERFAMVISNESGEGGAAITRRCFGETIALVNQRFPQWFCGAYKKYSDRENDLPVDSHFLLALIAPRPLYVASASQDLWADPAGEFLACRKVEPVYRLLGTEGFGANAMPAVNTPVGKTISYHLRDGKHEMTEYDWEQYLAFADRHLVRRP